MREKLGEEAVVLRANEVKEGGLLGFMGRTLYEVTAAGPAPVSARKLSAVERKYASAGSESGNEASTVAYFQKLVQDAQRRMNKAKAAAPAPPQSGNTAMQPMPEVRRPDLKLTPHDELQREVREMRDLLQVLAAETPGTGLPAEFASHYRMLVDKGVTRKTAAALVSSVVKDSDLKVMRDPRVFTERLKVEIRRRTTVTGGIALRGGLCKIVALVGATGVGKTTSLAKLAALFAIRMRARTALVTADTYRVAASEQLRVYANIIGLPMKVLNEPREAPDVLREFKDYDLILMDTAGGSPFNSGQMQELKAMLDVVRPDEVMLTMAANTQIDDLRQALLCYGAVKPTSLLFTKLDETQRFGAMLSILVEMGLPLSYCCMGQNVPDDLVLAQPGAVANLIMEGRSDRGRSSATTS